MNITVDKKEPETLRVPTLTTADLKVDYMSILRTQSKTKDSEQMENEVLRQLALIKGVDVQRDEYGNIYATKGKSDSYPVYVCHVDTVHAIRPSFVVHRSPRGFYYGFSDDKGFPQMAGIGGDDKCGIIACIELLFRLKNVKCVFFKDEESGCLGSKEGELTFFDNARFAIQIDRKHNCDIITTGNGTELCSKDFRDHISQIGAVYGYKPTTGANTDVVALKRRGLGISCVNISAGYWEPHKDTEFISERDLLNTIEFAKAMGLNKSIFPHKFVETTPTTTHYSSRGGSYNAPGFRNNYRANSVHRDVSSNQSCIECNTTLTYSEKEDRVCKSCIDAVKAEVYLVERDGKLELQVISPVQTSDHIEGEVVVEPAEHVQPTIELPSEFAPTLPAEKCFLCNEVLMAGWTKNRGYCAPCGFCKCGRTITTPEGLNLQACDGCIETIDENPQQKERICSDTGCKSLLTTQEELENDTCYLCTMQNNAMNHIY